MNINHIALQLAGYSGNVPGTPLTGALESRTRGKFSFFAALRNLFAALLGLPEEVADKQELPAVPATLGPNEEYAMRVTLRRDGETFLEAERTPFVSLFGAKPTFEEGFAVRVTAGPQTLTQTFAGVTTSIAETFMDSGVITLNAYEETPREEIVLEVGLGQNRPTEDGQNIILPDGTATPIAIAIAPCSNSDADRTNDCPPPMLFGRHLDPRDVRCGDGIVEGEEQCDDGNISNLDSCSRTCTTITPCTSCAEMAQHCIGLLGRGCKDDGYDSRCDTDGDFRLTPKDAIFFVNREGAREEECLKQCDADAPECSLLCDNGVLDPGEECEFGMCCANGGTCSKETCTCTPPPCLTEGRRGVPGGPGCCEGLVQVPALEDIKQQCVQPQDGGFLCLACGNGICEQTENRCTCAMDCPYCGNGKVEKGEECDSGTLNGKIFCSPECRFVPPRDRSVSCRVMSGTVKTPLTCTVAFGTETSSCVIKWLSRSCTTTLKLPASGGVAGHFSPHLTASLPGFTMQKIVPGALYFMDFVLPK